MMVQFDRIISSNSSPGLAGERGRDGRDGIKGEMGFHGPPGRKVDY